MLSLLLYLWWPLGMISLAAFDYFLPDVPLNRSARWGFIVLGPTALFGLLVYFALRATVLLANDTLREEKEDEDATS